MVMYLQDASTLSYKGRKARVCEDAEARGQPSVLEPWELIPVANKSQRCEF